MPIIDGARSRPFKKDGEPGNGDFAGEADPGDLLSDIDAGALYLNTGTKAAPVWTLVGPAAE